MCDDSAVSRQSVLAAFQLDYADHFGETLQCDESRMRARMSELAYLWRDSYVAASSRLTSIIRVQSGSFEYIYDNYSYLEQSGVVEYDSNIEDRLVVVFGVSMPRSQSRDDYRLRGWVGPTEKTFGRRYDKGHFIAHAIGGAVDKSEINVFVQRRDLNRGWSEEGKLYRAMEKYCVLNPGTFCFSRPIYCDQTSKPAFLEYGVLRQPGDLWVERFENR